MNRLTTFTKILLLLAFVGLTVGVCVVAGCGTQANQEAAAPLPTPTLTADLTIGGAVRDVGNALHRWDDYIYSHHRCTEFVTSNCVADSTRSRVADALRAYIKARPAGPLSTKDTRPAPVEYVHASRDLVVAIADGIEFGR